MARMTRMTRMTRMARWLADLADPFKNNSEKLREISRSNDSCDRAKEDL